MSITALRSQGRLGICFVFLFLAGLSGSVKASNSIDGIKVEPNPVKAGQVVTITVTGDDAASAYCGLLVVFGDNQEQRILVGAGDGPFPKRVTHTYANSGSYVVKAAGRKVNDRFHCVGGATTKLVVEFDESMVRKNLIAPPAPEQKTAPLPPAPTLTILPVELGSQSVQAPVIETPSSPRSQSGQSEAAPAGVAPSPSAPVSTQVQQPEMPSSSKPGSSPLWGLFVILGVAVVGGVLAAIIGALSNKVVFFYDNGDAGLSLGGLVCLVLGFYGAAISGAGGGTGNLILSVIMATGGFGGAAYFIKRSIDYSILDNRNLGKYVCVWIGLVKVAVAWWMVFWFFSALNRVVNPGTAHQRNQKKKQGNALSGAIIIGLLAGFFKLLNNGEKVYRTRGWILR